MRTFRDYFFTYLPINNSRSNRWIKDHTRLDCYYQNLEITKYYSKLAFSRQLCKQNLKVFLTIQFADFEPKIDAIRSYEVNKNSLNWAVVVAQLAKRLLPHQSPAVRTQSSANFSYCLLFKKWPRMAHFGKHSLTDTK